LSIRRSGRLLIRARTERAHNPKEQTMIQSLPKALVHLGQARRRTRADQDSGVLEEIPVHRFRTLETA
jgi:hypothetical protein